MYYTYVLKSQIFRKYYTGHANDLERRLREHNSGKTIYSRSYRPWRIVYYEAFHAEHQAVSRERYFKSAAGRKWLKKYVNK